MICLIYTSSAVNNHMDSDALIQILKKARQSNSLKNISGMLLYKDGQFLQILEGDKQNVETLYKNIKQDARHRNVTLVYHEPIVKKNFPNWSNGI